MPALADNRRNGRASSPRSPGGLRLPTAEPGAAAEPSTSAEAGSWGFEAGDEIVPGRHALEKLGGGHRYEAYLAWDDHLHATVVVKVVRPGRVADRAVLEGLAAEARALAALQHPVLLRGFGFAGDGPSPHLLLEHMEGPRLSTLVRRHGPLAREQFVPLALQLCSALHYMHAEGYLHLDVKPANIIMGAPPRLIDMSVACTVDEAAALREPVGTDSYMAPEQCLPRERGPVGPPADVFGLGVTLWRALTGERPYPRGETATGEGGADLAPEERWPQLVAAPPRLDAGLPPAAAAAVEAAIDPDPARRPLPAELAAELEQVLATLPRPRLGKLRPRWR